VPDRSEKGITDRPLINYQDGARLNQQERNMPTPVLTPDKHSERGSERPSIKEKIAAHEKSLYHLNPATPDPSHANTSFQERTISIN
jgi:hypothetical protein